MINFATAEQSKNMTLVNNIIDISSVELVTLEHALVKFN